MSGLNLLNDVNNAADKTNLNADVNAKRNTADNHQNAENHSHVLLLVYPERSRGVGVCV